MLLFCLDRALHDFSVRCEQATYHWRNTNPSIELNMRRYQIIVSSCRSIQSVCLKSRSFVPLKISAYGRRLDLAPFPNQYTGNFPGINLLPEGS